MMRKFAALLLSATFTLSAAPALADNLVDGSDPELIRSLVSGFGSAVTETDSIGDPRIFARIDGTKYHVYFYGCDDDNKHCRSIQFYAGWSGADVAVDVLNAWNRDARFGKTYLTPDGTVALEMDVNLDFGVSQRNFDDTVAYWDIVLRDFRQTVIAAAPEASDSADAEPSAIASETRPASLSAWASVVPYLLGRLAR
ncbi:YbjN domain-containing protein [Devosia sp.]|uniref:YbjN domain-containing protein n=1 Tax=Devosia sp. TaxID=1871048 RepID=UPI003A923223